MTVPGYVRQILTRLETAGFAACTVGGCVRDTLLGREVSDWDIATAARPEQVCALFDKTVPTGIAHGTVTVLLPDGSAEVTTFRTDGAYEDNRHPSQVQFTQELTQDLSRRDFTVNAMAMDLRGRLFDCFDGQTDLAAGVIRCVGQPEERFREDALRMLRAVRFTAQLGFEIEPATLAAIRTCAPLCAQLSAERVRDELKKTLLSDRPEQIELLLSLGLLACFGCKRAPLQSLRSLPRDELVRWTALKLALPELPLAALRLDRRTTQLVNTAAEAYRTPLNRLQYKQLLAAYGETVAACIAALNNDAPVLREILASGECVSLRSLALGGADFPSVEGRQLGQLLQVLLQHVLAHPQDNTKQALRALAEQLNTR